MRATQRCDRVGSMTHIGQLPPAIAFPLPGPVGSGYVESLASAECPALTMRRSRRRELSGAPHDPIVWTEAQGANVIDADGNIFVDLTAGFGACAIGHRHPRITEAIKQQTDCLLHALGDVQPAEVKIRLLDRLARLAPFPQARVILGLNGSDAVEAALKTAIRATSKPGILAFQGGYHGLSYGSLAICGYKDEFRAPFVPQLNPHVSFAPYPGRIAGQGGANRLTAAVNKIITCWDRSTSEIGAVIVEPILGRGGVVPPLPGFLSALSSLCQSRGAVLIVDEIFTGMGRCGSYFLCQQENVIPDLICVGKSLGSGLPISACIGRSDVMAAWGNPDQESLHTATFFGHPLSCAAALSTLQTIEDENLCSRSKELGTELLQQLRAIGNSTPKVVRVDGCGMMVGIELQNGNLTLQLVRRLLEKGYITLTAGCNGEVLSLSPPISIAFELIQGFVETLSDVLGEI